MSCWRGLEQHQPLLSLSLSLSLFLSPSLPKLSRHLQVFNEEIAPIKGAALAVKKEHEATERDKEGGDGGTARGD